MSPAFDDYLRTFQCTGKAAQYTHTRIGNKELSVYGGVYNISDDDKDEFYDAYYDNVFIKKRQEYLTEKQLIEDGPIVVDLDLHYGTDVETRLHTKDHVIDLIMLYAEKIDKLLEVDSDEKIPVFIFEKPTINMLDTMTKDGIHMLIGIKMHKALQAMLREKVLEDIGSMFEDLPVINTWDMVVDEGVTKGHSNWQLYGSRKPGHKAYELTGVYYISYNLEAENWDIEEKRLSSFDVKTNFRMLSAQNSEHVGFEVKSSVMRDYERAVENLSKKTGGGKKPATGRKNIIVKAKCEDIFSVTNEEELDTFLEDLFNEIRPVEYELRETHNFVMILPESYYGAGSYNKWIRVGWALKNTSEKLFATWVKFSSQSPDFSYDDIPALYDRWQKFEYRNEDGLTHKSIMYWAKSDSEKEKYKQVRAQTIDYFIDQTIQTSTEFDFANVLYNIFKDSFVCASIKCSLWYEYKGHRWEEIDSGSTLRLLISKDMHDKYCQRLTQSVDRLATMDQSHEKYDGIRKSNNKIAEICVLLKKTSWKNNIMREAQELFYDRDFTNKLDQNPYLLCFNNGIIDFKTNIFRRGQPDDYLSICTNIEYSNHRANNKNQRKVDAICAEIDEFMEQLFPNEELREYMWSHLASCLIGTNENQTFNIYTGSGANGKSKLVDLMSKCLGDYKGTVPLTLITQKRTSIGSTSSEIVQLKGKRLAVMQEPSKGDSINEGTMKEITGGDPIQGRALFRDMITFIPQFKLIVTTNSLFDIRSNDDGTWRRIRLCDFMSKFIDEPFGDQLKFPTEFYPYQFKIDKKLDSKFVEWAPVFMSKLVEIAFVNKGHVRDCNQVLAASDGYRNGQDFLSEFAKDMIKRVQGESIKTIQLKEEFKSWYELNYGRGKPIQPKELHDFMDKRFGTRKKGAWQNVKIVKEDEEDEPDIAEL